MKKIPTIFKRNPENIRELLDKPHPDCAWVFSGEGAATQKYDGTCCSIADGVFYKRREIKKGKEAPSDFIEETHDKTTGKKVGWVPVAAEDKWHLEAFHSYFRPNLTDGTYELVGPKIQGNPEGFKTHCLLSHDTATRYGDVPRTFDGLKKWLGLKDIEGLVFHHPDGRMAKIKKKDFGMKRKI